MIFLTKYVYRIQDCCNILDPPLYIFIGCFTKVVQANFKFLLVLKKKSTKYFEILLFKLHAMKGSFTREVPVYGVFLVRIFPHLDSLSLSLYLVRMRENVDQKNSECVHFSCSVVLYTETFSSFTLIFLSPCIPEFILK